jgi:F0F1-type ATP synthase beta subunit
MSNNIGTVTQVIGSTLDAQFAEDQLPSIYNALKVELSRTVLGERRTRRLGAVARASGRWRPPSRSARPTISSGA